MKLSSATTILLAVCLAFVGTTTAQGDQCNCILGGCDQTGCDANAQCGAGRCNQSGLVSPSCSGGFCNQKDALNPECDTGFCNQPGSSNPQCGAGFCCQDGATNANCLLDTCADACVSVSRNYGGGGGGGWLGVTNIAADGDSGGDQCQCGTGGCDQTGCGSGASCDAGRCNQEGLVNPSCGAGSCNQKNTQGATCKL